MSKPASQHPRPENATAGKKPGKRGRPAGKKGGASQSKSQQQERTQKQLTSEGVPFRFVTAKLYGEDAEKADWVADHANLTDLVTSSVRLVHATLQKFFNKTLPDYYSTPRVKLRGGAKETHQLMVELPGDVLREYIAADEAFRQRLGSSPGAEALMALAIQRQKAEEIADGYVAAVREQIGER
jgi:hypothetical protein